MSTFIITFGRGEWLNPSLGEPTETDTHDISHYCSRLCAESDLHTLALDFPFGDLPTVDGVGIARANRHPSLDQPTTVMVSWGDSPCAASEVDYILFCEGCGSVMNGTELESFDTHRRTVEDGLREVIGWAIERGFTDIPSGDAELLDPSFDLDAEREDVGGATGHERLQWLFEEAESYLGDLDGYYFDQDGETATTTLWCRDSRDPAKVES